MISVPNYWTSTKITPTEKEFFQSNPYKIEVIITYFIEILEIPNLGHMSAATI